MKANPQLPQKLTGIQMIPVGAHGFQTPTGKFELWSTIIQKHPGLNPLPTYRDSVDNADPVLFPFRLVAGARLPGALHSRLHDVPWLRSLRPQPMADISPEDAQALGIRPGDKIRVSTSAGSICILANPTLQVKKGCVHIYHGYREADVNAIIPPGHNDPYSGFPGFRSVRCAIARLEKEGEA